MRHKPSRRLRASDRNPWIPFIYMGACSNESSNGRCRMKLRRCVRVPYYLFFAAALPLSGVAQTAELSQQTTAKGDRYDFRKEHDPDGIGKFYMGREIALVMGHQGADWLER